MQPSPIAKAIEKFGTQQAFAESLGLTQGAVSHWLLGIRSIKPERAIQIEEATNGQVTRYELCPDFPWDGAQRIHPEEAEAA